MAKDAALDPILGSSSPSRVDGGWMQDVLEELDEIAAKLFPPSPSFPSSPSPPAKCQSVDEIFASHHFNDVGEFVPKKRQSSQLDPSAKAKYYIYHPLIKRQAGKERLTQTQINDILASKLKILHDKKAKEWEKMAEGCPYGSECYKVCGDGDGEKEPISDVHSVEMAMRAAAANAHTGKHPVTLLGLCGIPEHNGGHTLANFGYCLEGWEFNDTQSTSGALNWEATLAEMNLSFLVSREHLFNSVLFNSRLCPVTETGVGCPAWDESEADLRADEINFLHEFYVDIGLMPIFINIAGRDPKNKPQLVYDRLNRTHIALGIWHLLHMQFYGGFRDLRVVDQIAHVSLILDEFCDLAGQTSCLAERSFEEIMISKFMFSSQISKEKMSPEELLELRKKHYQYLNECRRVKNDFQWMKRYNELLHFKKLNKHCNVPIYAAGESKGWSKELGKWVSKQRSRKTDNTLREDREELLKQAGFVFTAIGEAVRVRKVVNGSPSKTDYEDFASLYQATKSKNGCGEGIKVGGKWVKITRDMVRGAPNGVLIIDKTDKRRKNRQTNIVSVEFIAK